MCYGTFWTIRKHKTILSMRSRAWPSARSGGPSICSRCCADLKSTRLSWAYHLKSHETPLMSSYPQAQWDILTTVGQFRFLTARLLTCCKTRFSHNIAHILMTLWVFDMGTLLFVANSHWTYSIKLDRRKHNRYWKPKSEVFTLKNN